MIIGIGVDVCSVERFEASIARQPGMLARLFVDSELEGASTLTLAGRFAAKEALAKALGAPAGLVWRDAVVLRTESGAPRIEMSDSVQARATELGVERLHLSISHDAGVALAMVVAEADS